MPPRYIDESELQAREQAILDQALAIISAHGLAALNMDKLIAQVPYSKGTVYNHFSSKEDVFTALCNRNMRRVEQLFQRAAAIDGSAWDKMTAIGFAYMLSVLLSPQHFMLVMSAKTELFDKASIVRREEHDLVDQQLFGVIEGVIEQAIANGELKLRPGAVPQQVSFSLWAMAFGTIGLLLGGDKSCGALDGMMIEGRVIAHGNLIKEGLGWAGSDWDQQEFLQWLKTDVFAEELQQLEQQGVFLNVA